MQTSAVVDGIIEVLAPYLGETMARASTRGVCDKLGLRGDRMSAEEAEALVAKLASGLRVFVGREKAAQVVEEMRRSLNGSGS